MFNSQPTPGWWKRFPPSRPGGCSPALADVGGHRKHRVPTVGALPETPLRWQHKQSWASWGDHLSPQHTARTCWGSWEHSSPNPRQHRSHLSTLRRYLWNRDAAFQNEHHCSSAQGGEGGEGRTLPFQSQGMLSFCRVGGGGGVNYFYSKPYVEQQQMHILWSWACCKRDYNVGNL